MAKHLKPEERRYMICPVPWIDRAGEEHAIDAMQTRHLFYSLTMLWNNTMPVKTRLGYRTYTFKAPRFRDRQYLHDVIKGMWLELESRPDVSRQWQAELDVISRHATQSLQALTNQQARP